VVSAVASLHHMDARSGLIRLRSLVAPGGVLVVIGLARSDLPKDIPSRLRPRSSAGFGGSGVALESSCSAVGGGLVERLVLGDWPQAGEQVAPALDGEPESAGLVDVDQAAE
jgi:hypothetical protein